jgi:hypothetical protein
MKGIGHVKSSYWDWFHSSSYLEQHKNKIVMVLSQNNLDRDFVSFQKKTNLNLGSLPSNSLKAHKTPDHYDKSLSASSVIALKEWYQKEYEFLDCLYQLKLIPIPYNR